jgi:outer membrane protein assembly factor BamB
VLKNFFILLVLTGFSGPVWADDRVEGSLIWRSRLDGPVFSPPALQFGRVYVGTKGGIFHCLDAEDGTTEWTYKTGDEIYSRAAFYGEFVLFGSCDGNLYCLNAETGAARWRFETGGMVQSPVLVSGGRIYFGSFDSNFYCLAASNGLEEWRFRASGTIRGGCAIDRGRLFFGDGAGNLYALDMEGEVLWTRCSKGGILGTPVAEGGEVYAGDLSGEMNCCDAADGKLRWSFATRDQIFNGPCLEAGTACFCGWDGFIRSIDRASGHEIWSSKTPDGIYPAPLAADGRVYAGGDDGIVRCLDGATGQLLWMFPTGADIAGTPAISDGRLYTGSYDGKLYCIDTGIANLDAGVPVPQLPAFRALPVIVSPSRSNFVLVAGESAAIDFLVSNAGRGRAASVSLESLLHALPPGVSMALSDPVELAAGQCAEIPLALSAEEWADAATDRLSILAKDRRTGISGNPIEVPFFVCRPLLPEVAFQWGGTLPPDPRWDPGDSSDYAPRPAVVEAWVIVRNPGERDIRKLWVTADFSGDGLELAPECRDNLVGDLPAGESAVLRIRLLPDGGDVSVRGVLAVKVLGSPYVQSSRAYFPVGSDARLDATGK